MKIHLAKAIFINRAPFDKLELDFSENEILVLTAVNGKGKTTLLSHIADAYYEMAKPHFPNEFEEKKDKYYRVSSLLYNQDPNKSSYVYLRFKIEKRFIDYLDIRKKCTVEEYNEAITIEGKIDFNEISQKLEQSDLIKKVSSNFDKKMAELIFSDNILTYFPSYRFEMPGYLNDPYKIKIDFKMHSDFSGYLINPIEVITGLPQLANWIMDIVLDFLFKRNDFDQMVFENLNLIISKTLISKENGNLRFGVGPRGFGETRIQILNSDNKLIYPSIFNLSSGESSILCLFGELLRQADNIKSNIEFEQITGIVLIDEVEKHLHIKLQKEVLPILFNLFPNVQFILSSHSPFLSMGLAELSNSRSKIIDLDNLGISKDPTSNELYTEVYNMMIRENDRFKDLYQSLENKIHEGKIPLIITEGKTDVQHIKKAMEKLKIDNCNIEFFEISDNGGDSKLKLLLEQSSKINQSRKIIGIFDRDDTSIVSEIEKGKQLFKDYSNNVYGFCIPIPPGREKYTNISIEFYYNDEEIKKLKEGKRLYFDNEVDYLYNKSTNQIVVNKLDNPRLEKESSKKLFDEPKMCKAANWIHSKASFAKLVETDDEWIKNFNFDNFKLIFEKIKVIINDSESKLESLESFKNESVNEKT